MNRSQSSSAPSDLSVSEAITQLLASMDKPYFTARELVAMMGDKGLLMVCALMTLPFLFPVSIPGVSTVFGLAILLIALSISVGRLPWLPAFVADRRLDAAKLKPVLKRGVAILKKLDRVLRPQRLRALTVGFMNNLNGAAIMFAAVLLMLPLGLVPFSNTLPSIAILLLALGISQRDGVVVLGGYLMIAGTLAYFSFLAWGAWRAGSHFFA
ncbi:exopolysaccharide biosynthesis protein [Lampropedia puyangensis]|uniref:Exopolysaccharide biosynthesis protein n=1 Tax=Lampropedia puyangensis TaxID=1330072 RepID=A0A4V6T2U4_9BURK|nr:exopolysaccharide biosynthesis protein [Lampropedia puyangensis]THU05376.1 exopolysaccharide biosynthesis protein [Lampropedia puyangensis]